jgi:hypothetical protein
VGKDDPPPFSKARPCLTLPPASDLSLDFPLEGYGNAGQNIFLVGSTHLGRAALTVIIGSFTTWLMRSFMTTLHSR